MSEADWIMPKGKWKGTALREIPLPSLEALVGAYNAIRSRGAQFRDIHQRLQSGLAERRHEARGAAVAQGVTASISIEYLRPPFAPVHPVPAWAQPVDPLEACPFEPDSGLDELDAEYRAIIG